MGDPRALVRLVDELLWRLRREGFVVSTAQAIDVARAVEAVGIGRGEDVANAVAAVVVDRPADRRRFDATLEAFFGGRASQPSARSLWDRLAAAGFGVEEIGALRDALDQLAAQGTDGMAPLGALLGRGAELDRLLAISESARSVDAYSRPQLGFRTHRALAEIGAPQARRGLAALRAALVDALGDRGQALADVLSTELESAEEEARRHVTRLFEARLAELEQASGSGRTDATPFVALADAQIEEVRRAVRSFAQRLRGGARVRARRALRGRLDPHRTLRRALRTGGVPFSPARKARRRDRPKLVLLCDVSDSVRAVATFLLEFVYAAQELFDRTRSFVFVSELGEVTDLFAREPVRMAIARAYAGGVVRVTDNSNYGRVLRAFERDHLRDVDRRTTVVVLGDGRTNYHDAAADVLDRIRQRARGLLWLCPEARGQWAEGDSAMSRYASKCTAVYEVRCAADLERAARAIVARG
jgi:uncharacterized protein with von Willebrand factor type A (vWA) domain